MVQIKKIVIAVLIGLALFGLASAFLEPVHARLVGAIGLLVTLWTNEGLPLGATSLLPIILFPALGLIDTNAVAANYSKTIIFLFLGGFLLAIATEKIKLHKVVAHKILSIFPKTPKGIIFALALTGAVLSSILSNTTTALLLIPIALFLSDVPAMKTRLVLAVAYGCSIGGILTPIGTPPNLILMGFLEENSLPVMTFMEWMLMTAPLVIVMIGVMTILLSLGTKGISITVKKEENTKLSRGQKTLMFTILALVVLLFANSPIGSWPGLGLNEKALLLGFGLLMFVPKIGVLNWGDTKKVPYEIIFLFGAGFAIASAFSSTGLADYLAGLIMGLTSLPVALMILVVGLMVTFTTEVTSNTALVSIVLPVILALGQAGGVNTNLLLMVATICASYAFMLPIATPPNAIAMSSGAVEIKQMARYGVILNIIGVVLVTLLAIIFWGGFIS